jgi:hypothetical protein
MTDSKNKPILKSREEITSAEMDEISSHMDKLANAGGLSFEEVMISVRAINNLATKDAEDD